MQRIFLHPGEVKSKNDGDIHFISAQQLARLYGVNYKECHVIYQDRPETSRGVVARHDDVHLFPRYDGNYKKHNDDLTGPQRERLITTGADRLRLKDGLWTLKKSK